MVNYTKVQNYLNTKNKSIKLFKTHSTFFKRSNGVSFCNFESSLGAIYIVRDPRNVVTSYSHHYSTTVEKSCDQMIKEDMFIAKSEFNPAIYVSSWRLNYLSWKKVGIPVLFIRYEDLIKNTKEKLIEVFNFFKTLGMNKNLYDDKKLDKVIKSTQFYNMKKLEKKMVFEKLSLRTKLMKKYPFLILDHQITGEIN